MHINLLDLPRVDLMLAERRMTFFRADPMPASTSWSDLQTVLRWEERLRLNQTEFTADACDLEPYWREVIGLFEVYRQIAHHPQRPVTPQALALLRSGHRWLVQRRWPDRMPRSES